MRTLTILIALAIVTTMSAQENSSATRENSNDWLITTTIPLINSVGSANGLIPLGTGFVRYTDDSDYSENYIGVNIGTAYQVISNLYVGLNLGFGRNWSSFDDEDFSSNTFIAGPRVRYYIPIKQVSFFADANVAFGKSKAEFDLPEFSSESTVTTFGGALGIAYPLSSTVDIEGLLSYDRFITKDEDDDKDKGGVTSIRIGFSIRI